VTRARGPGPDASRLQGRTRADLRDSRRDGRPELILLGTGDAGDRARTRFAIGAAIARLPEAAYTLDPWPVDPDASEIALGYLFSLYRFTRYRSQAAPKARLARRPISTPRASNASPPAKR
jgi:leucyl aminopeptidase